MVRLLLSGLEVGRRRAGVLRVPQLAGSLAADIYQPHAGEVVHQGKTHRVTACQFVTDSKLTKTLIEHRSRGVKIGP